MTDIKEIKKSLDESREGLEDFGRVTRDYTLMKAFISDCNMLAEYEKYAKEILNELQTGDAAGTGDIEQTLDQLSEDSDSGINSPEEN